MELHDLIGEVAEETGEIAGEVIKAPFKIVGGLLDNLFG